MLKVILQLINDACMWYKTDDSEKHIVIAQMQLE